MRRLLDRAVAASSNGIVITDPKLPDNPIVYVNPAFEKISGYATDEVRGRNCRFLQADDRDQSALDELRVALREKRECRVVLRNYRKDGTPFWNELYVSPVHDEDGRLTNFVGVQNDISERRRIEEVLRESEERFRATFEHAAIGAAQVGIDGRWLRVNRRLSEIVGYEREELLQRTFQDITHPDDLEGDLAHMRLLLEGELQTYTMEKRYLRKGGPEVWVNITVSLVRDASGEPAYFIAVVEDISERKKAEEERDLLLVREQLARAEAVAARRRLTLLAAAGPALAASLDYEQTLEDITRLLVPELADWCLLDIVEDDGSVNQLAAAHAEEEKEDLLRKLREHRRFGEGDPGSTAEVLRTGRSVLLSDLPDTTFYEPELEGEHLEIVNRLEPRSLMCVPLLARGRTIGAITLISSRLDRCYDEDDLMLAEDLAYRCALSADNARLYRDRSEIARVLQRSLLPPHLPEIPGVQVGAEYLPVGEANDVGGDFYDLINTVEDGWLCAIGDVRGKGVEAASVTALARYTIRAVTLKNDRPSEVLAALNEAMLRQLPEDRFCTAACVRLESQDDGSAGVRVDVSRAGHPPPLMVHSGGEVEEVGCSGRVLGVFPDAELRDTSLRLMPGETLVLYTDGVTEARSPDGDFFGEGKLRHLLSSCAGCDAVTLARRIKGVVLDFQEGYPRDDLAILVLRAGDGAASAEQG
jgi:PAS domain S-box-containing protein